MPTADRANPNGVLIIGEMANGVPIPLVFELLALSRRLCTEASVSILVLGNLQPAVCSQLIAAGADRVYTASWDRDGLYESDVWLAALREVLTRVSPRLVLAGHTALGADLAPRLAFQLNAAIATDCEEIVLRDGWLHATRPCFGHKAREVLSLRTDRAVATVRARSNEPLSADTSRVGEMINLPMPALESAAIPRVRSRTREDAKEGPRLETANIVVAGGRGLGGPEGFAELAKLASALGGVVGASRVACDLGWCPHSWQIGLTGKTVTPALYIAVGISGASHHMAGCGNAAAILAINSDPEAAIFKEARFGLVGDYREIVPALVKEVVRLRSHTGISRIEETHDV
jgi:electron transfer flavoprotein alpha subunit